MKSQTKLAKSRADSLTRTSQERARVAKSLSTAETRERLDDIIKPNSISKTLKKMGIMILLSPDPLGPIIDIPGVVLLSASYFIKGREPMGVESVFRETQQVLDDLQQLF
ncbi:MAG: hypothetical protein JRM77_05490 [Nitrososphaerota archaeon]|nr:hypothetical protein [Nitrososphaerota archaeon]